ncbi:alpha/beta-hydrolase, partial [Ramaria rubella]
QLSPSESLDWTPCYNGFECARLVVPLDYTDGSATDKAVIAVTRYPSIYPIGHEKWRGPILYNPGGPGGLGVDNVLENAKRYVSIIGRDYDHVGFDPRGVGRSTPTLDVFPDAFQRKLVETQIPYIDLNSNTSIKRTVGEVAAAASLLGTLAIQNPTVRYAAEHMSTALVARDMLSITRAFGREKLLYWGFSYGSFLGMTFASMFPDKVERIIVDGVVDAEDYAKGLWFNNLLDIDKLLNRLFEYCSLSTEEHCPLISPSVQTPAQIRARVDGILELLRTAPMAVANATSSQFGIITHHLVHLNLFKSLYAPLKLFPSFAQALVDLEKGDGHAMLRLFDDANQEFQCDCTPSPGFHFAGRIKETGVAVACGDADPVEESHEDLERFFERAGNISEFASEWDMHVFCSEWKIRPVERFNGPFGGNTSFPMLFIGNTAGELQLASSYARKMSEMFQGAVTLTQNSEGHCSYSASSLCTVRHVRNYFRDGVLPPRDTVCEVESRIFSPAIPKKISQTPKIKEDQELLEASIELVMQGGIYWLGK